MTGDEVKVDVYNPHWTNENKMRKKKQYEKKKKKVSLVLAKNIVFLFYKL